MARAGKLAEAAMHERDPERAIELAQRALAISQDCADAYTVLSQFADLRHGLQICVAGVAAAERMLADSFDSEPGHFWEHAEARPYLRARVALAQQLWDVGQRTASVKQFEEVLEFDRDDHQGVRYLLLARLLQMRRPQEAEVLLDRFEEDSPTWTFARALAAFQREGDSQASRQWLQAGCRSNEHILPMLLDRSRSPADEQDDRGSDSPEQREAEEYLAESSAGWVGTPGAMTWLRQIRSEANRDRHSASSVGPTEAVKKKLKSIRQDVGTHWQVAVVEMPTWYEEQGEIIRPWSVMFLDLAERLVLGQTTLANRPTAAELFDALSDAIRRPMVGKPHRPGEIQVIETADWESIRPAIEEIGIDCIYRKSLDEADEALAELERMMLAEQPLGLTQVPGLELSQVGAFFDAAAEYYRQAPWCGTPDQTAIRVECRQLPQAGPGLWQALVMGQAGMTCGLALHETQGSLQDLWQSDSPEDAVALLQHSLSVTFGENFDAPIADFLAAQRHGWPIGGPEAYPSVIRPAETPEDALPSAAQVPLLEACLRAIPQFVARHTFLHEPVSETIAVDTSAGRIELQLSWELEDDACGGDCEGCDEHCDEHCE